MKKILIFALICLACAGCRSSGPSRNDSSENHVALTISAAASLKDAFVEIASLYEKKTGQDVVFNFGASGALQKQIETGAAVDIFASAGSKQMDDLAAKQLVDNETRRDFAGNELVLIVPQDSKITLSDFAQLNEGEVKQIAVGNPKTVPAGQYSQQVFLFLKLDDVLQQKLVLAEDVRQVLDYVERGEVDAGIVYKTDAMIAGGKVRMVAEAPPTSHDPILYPIVVINDSNQKNEAQKFIEILCGPDGQSILSKYGFSVVKGK